jgi:DNA-binding NarL/FixJ family response regulator
MVLFLRDSALPMSRRVRILIVDDHDALRSAIRSLLESRPEFEICGEAKDGPEGVAKSAELRPDVVSLDISMPIMNGFEAARRIKVVSPQSRIVILSSYQDEQLLAEAAKVGAFCYVPKAEAGRELIEAVSAAGRVKHFGDART